MGLSQNREHKIWNWNKGKEDSKRWERDKNKKIKNQQKFLKTKFF